MKRIFKIIYAAFFILMITFSLVSGQDKKSEEKIKIIVDDGSGKKVVIDTVFYNSPRPDSIKLKDGTVIYLKNQGEEADFKHHAGENDDVMLYNNSDSHEGRNVKKYTVITRKSKDHGDKGETIYINKGVNPKKEVDNTFDIYVSDTDNDSTIEKTKYVIAKDGMVVTVEGNDETKTKELVKEIETKLGVNSEGTEKKETVKVESKKIIKK